MAEVKYEKRRLYDPKKDELIDVLVPIDDIEDKRIEDKDNDNREQDKGCEIV